jgi:hypothetical protein
MVLTYLFVSAVSVHGLLRLIVDAERGRFVGMTYLIKPSAPYFQKSLCPVSVRLAFHLPEFQILPSHLCALALIWNLKLGI